MMTFSRSAFLKLLALLAFSATGWAQQVTPIAASNMAPQATAPSTVPQSRGEYIVDSGGPALRRWENLREPNTQHDRWWANFIRSARVRMQQLHQMSPGMTFTWFVYRPSYVTRTGEDNQPLISYIQSVTQTYPFIRLRWFSSTSELLSYINSGNNRGSNKIVGFEFFGHSNKFCFMFDYSNEIIGTSRCWLHEKELGRISGSAFARDAYCKSWGCHTGESMAAAWRQVTGVPMIGAMGKTDYSSGEIPLLSSPGGRWSY